MAEIVIPGDEAVVEVKEPGKDWLEIGGTANASTSGGEAPETDIVTYKATVKLSGRARVPSMTIPMPAFLPHMPVAEILRKARDAKTALQFRLRTNAEEIFKTAEGKKSKLTISNAGVVTIAAADGDNDPDPPDFTDTEVYGAGMVITAGDKKYIITSIKAGVVTTVESESGAAEALAATDTSLSIGVPSLQLGPFVATVRGFGNFELAAENALSSSLELGLRNQLGAWKVQ